MKFNNSKIDHVALILRYSSGNIVLFETTGETGVILTDWNDFLRYNWHEQYQKIVYRKLYCERPTEMLVDLEIFIKGTIGKKYKIKTT